MKKMKNIIVFFGLLTCLVTNAQFKSFKIDKPYENFSKIDLLQIDIREHSTLVHFQLENYSDVGEYFYIGENFYLRDKNTNRKYRLLNSFNLPLENSNQFGFVEYYGDKLNFTLEFEKTPKELDYFDLIESEGSKTAFNIYGVRLDKSKRTEFIKLDNFISKTPVQTVNYYYREGVQVKHFTTESGIQIALFLSLDNNYGKYLRANFFIKNLTGNSITINPNYITAEYISKYGKGEVKTAEILDYFEYMKKVKRRQNWNSFANSFSESLEASTAGYSSSTTNTTINSQSSTYAAAYGYNGNTYSSAYGAAYSYGNASVNSQTSNYNGAAAYAARQNAKNNIQNFQNRQSKIKKTLSEGYLKRNTIENETEYFGYVNIPYRKKMKKFKITILLKGEEFVFIF